MKSLGAVLLLVTSGFVFWKTVIFLWYDNRFLTADAKAYTPESLLCYYFPSSIWIVMPLVSMYGIGKGIVEELAMVMPKAKTH